MFVSRFAQRAIGQLARPAVLTCRAPQFRIAFSAIRFQSTAPSTESEPIIGKTPAAKLYTYPEIKQLTLHPDANKVLVDVREPDELKLYGTIPTAINIPFKSTPGALDLPEEEFQDLFDFEKPSKDKELIFFCQAGLRSTAAEELVGTFGYKHRGNYNGSFNDWYENESKLKQSTQK